jgi:hypothetical protein
MDYWLLLGLLWGSALGLLLRLLFGLFGGWRGLRLGLVEFEPVFWTTFSFFGVSILFPFLVF